MDTMPRIPRRKIAAALGLKEDAADVLDEIQNFLWLYRQNKSAVKTIPKRKQRKEQLAQFASALSTIVKKLPTVELAFADVNEYADLYENARILYPIVKEMADEKSRRGIEKDDREWLLCSLARVFETETKSRPTITYSDYGDKGRYIGPFFEFVRLVLPPSEFTDMALGKAIQKAIPQYRRGKDE